MVEDIDADILQSNKILEELSKRSIRLDTLLEEITSNRIIEDSRMAHNLWTKTHGFPDFIQNDRTIQQLKSSGSLRLIKNKGVSDKIMLYDQKVRQLGVTQNNFNSFSSRQ